MLKLLMQISRLINHAKVFDCFQKPGTSGKFSVVDAFPIPTVYVIA